MKRSSVSFTLFLALAATCYGAPTAFEAGLTKRQTDQINSVIAELNAVAAKRDNMIVPQGSKKRETMVVSRGTSQLTEREYAIVTEVLSLINDTNLAPKIIQGLVDNTDIQPIITEVVTDLIKSGTINLTTLFTALDESGLASRVIKDIISDCTFYADIYKLAYNYISNLAQQVAGLSSKREITTTTELTESKRYDEDGVVNNLLESLANSGLASSVVRTLITDPKFLKYGASLIEKLFSSGALTIDDVVDALKDSDLVEDLFKEFFTVGTLETVIVNALKAASGQCGGTVSATSTIKTSTGTSTTSTATATACKKKRKRSYN